MKTLIHLLAKSLEMLIVSKGAQIDDNFGFAFKLYLTVKKI